MPVTLRPQQPDDLPLLTGGESPFDDFGPRAEPTTPSPAKLDAAGGLSVIADDGHVAGDISWHWKQWGLVSPLNHDSRVERVVDQVDLVPARCG